MLTANEIIKRLDSSTEKLYVRVKGFGVQEVKEVTNSIFKMNVCRVSEGKGCD